jgi:hypothetical protein
VSEPSEAPLRYRLLTGTDDRAFCEKVSAAIADGYELYGSPSIATRPDGTVVCAQAVVLTAPVLAAGFVRSGG